MRDIVFAVLVGIGFLVAGLLTAMAILGQQEQPRQAHHPYEPFTIEVAVRDI